MRELMIERMKYHLERSSDSNRIIGNTSRWGSLAEHLFARQGSDPSSKKGKRAVKSFTIDSLMQIAVTLSDSELAALFENVIRRAYTQM